ncbi:VWA domain-containing protein [Pseudozobellia sp. WGM2]|uniref:vWA domain-containing protein n=1 Tax=Pseudozobellia sp. WGM2 TaxID=2787625 RepID=UPI001ADF4FB4|nr:VWA domain-containing protein [Pseudozobellia sp. WGM2]
MDSSLIRHQTEISAHVVLLCRYLRNKGYTVSASEEAEALQAIDKLPIDRERNFILSLKAILAKNRYQYLNFIEHYEEFRFHLAQAADSKIKNEPQKEKKKSKAEEEQARFDALKSWLNLTPSVEEKNIAAFSDIEVLGKKHFSNLSEDEINLMMRLLKKLAKKVAHRKSRLRKVSKSARKIDLKHTIRNSMRNGGNVQKLVYSKPKNKKLKLILLCDVSKSMDLYSRFFVHLIYAFQNAYDKIETFVFSTALHRVSSILDNNDFAKAFDIVSDRVPDWSGGTSIGSSLQDFLDDYGYGMLDKKTIVLILSDGWDTGEPEIIQTAMKSIYKKSRKVIWLNPLAGSPDFSPEAIGMKAALPYIDALVSAHNLESLKFVLNHLKYRRNLTKTT